MAARRRFRAVSLDLWSTSLIERPGATVRLRDARMDFLQQSLSEGSEGMLTRPAIERAVNRVDEDLRSRGSDPIEVDPGTMVELYARAVSRTPARPLSELARQYSRVGFVSDPPPSNPEAEALIAWLEARGFPVIAISDTARSEASWQEFFRARTRLRFQSVVTSCEVGRAKPDPAIFQAGVRRLSLPPAAILHIGDRWDRDVLGALGAGLGAVLYSGLREPATADQDPLPTAESIARSGALHVRHLDDPALRVLLE